MTKRRKLGLAIVAAIEFLALEPFPPRPIDVKAARVPDGSFFLLGDNRRLLDAGEEQVFVPRDHMIGVHDIHD